MWIMLQDTCVLTARLYDSSDVRCLICFVQLGGYLTVIVNKDKNIALYA